MNVQADMCIEGWNALFILKGADKIYSGVINFWLSTTKFGENQDEKVTCAIEAGAVVFLEGPGPTPCRNYTCTIIPLTLYTKITQKPVSS